MKLYFGMSVEYDFELAKELNASILASYHYFGRGQQRKLVEDWIKDERGQELFIDSGAFSAFTLGKEIDIDEYCQFLLQVKPDVYVVLDIIDDPVRTYKNQKYMEKKYGLTPLPVYHRADNDLRFLHKIIEDYDYIALGGVVGQSKLTIEAFFDSCWSIIMDKKPDLKVHGFGLSAPYFMDKYPWESVDSTSYTGVVRYGDFNLYDEDFRKSTRIYIDDHLKELYGDDFIDDKTRATQEAKKIQMQEYLNLEKFITERHKEKDFSYLKRTLFG